MKENSVLASFVSLKEEIWNFQGVTLAINKSHVGKQEDMNFQEAIKSKPWLNEETRSTEKDQLLWSTFYIPTS